jgi:hypothetical protein
VAVIVLSGLVTAGFNVTAAPSHTLCIVARYTCSAFDKASSVIAENSVAKPEWCIARWNAAPNVATRRRLKGRAARHIKSVYVVGIYPRCEVTLVSRSGAESFLSMKPAAGYRSTNIPQITNRANRVQKITSGGRIRA